MLSNISGPILVIFVIAWGIIMFLKILTDYFLKKKMIETGSLNEGALNIFKESFPRLPMTSGNFASFSPLKWGLIFLCGGTGLITLEYLKYDYDSPLPYGVVSVAVSVGFLAYYLVVRAKENSIKQ
jgi:hypothetical protein